MEAQKQTNDKEVEDPLRNPIVIPDKIRKQAKGLGIDVGSIVDTANLLRERVLGIEGAIFMMAKGLDERDKKLEPLVNLAKQVEARKQAALSAPQQGQGAPQQGQGGGIGLQDLLPLLGGGSEPDPMTKVFMEAVFRAGLENMFMGGALIKTFVSKTAPELFSKAMLESEATISKALKKE